MHRYTLLRPNRRARRLTLGLVTLVALSVACVMFTAGGSLRILARPLEAAVSRQAESSDTVIYRRAESSIGICCRRGNARWLVHTNERFDPIYADGGEEAIHSRSQLAFVLGDGEGSHALTMVERFRVEEGRSGTPVWRTVVDGEDAALDDEFIRIKRLPEGSEGAEFLRYLDVRTGELRFLSSEPIVPIETDLSQGHAWRYVGFWDNTAEGTPPPGFGKNHGVLGLLQFGRATGPVQWVTIEANGEADCSGSHLHFESSGRTVVGGVPFDPLDQVGQYRAAGDPVSVVLTCGYMPHGPYTKIRVAIPIRGDSLVVGEAVTNVPLKLRVLTGVVLPKR